MELTFTRDAEAFERRAWEFLAARAERNILATVLLGARAGRYGERAPLFALGAGAGGELSFAALRTPPWRMLASALPEPEPAPAGQLLARWLELDPQLPGVSAEPGTARAIAAAWAERTGGATRCAMREALHRAEAVRDPPRPAPGGLRPARAGERALLSDWTRAFALEAGVGPVDPERAVEHSLARGGLLLWEEDGEPVSMVATNVEVAGVVRIGPVYTPPARRRRGYASSAVAAASRRALAAGASACMLFTDLANPTSNRIYAELGYRRFADWEEHAFTI
jgi:predicted GNAT family acetyltransferase